jgi:uncharacterized membrane protein YkgB
MRKAVAVHTLFLVAVTVIFLFFAIALFMGWIKITSDVANPAICNSKLLSYCSEWSASNYGSAPKNWADEAPGCVKIQIVPTIEKCKSLLQQS